MLPTKWGGLCVGDRKVDTARRAVTHLTFANPFWRSVPTCSVILRTEAGGTARVPVRAASRLLSAAPT
ncbi:MAG: hypothetical protein LBQ66_12090 [Planctomycetaceae bacterium]|nr:hypothetical protein [Planctomycetaceae bacterium]